MGEAVSDDSVIELPIGRCWVDSGCAVCRIPLIVDGVVDFCELRYRDCRCGESMCGYKATMGDISTTMVGSAVGQVAGIVGRLIKDGSSVEGGWFGYAADSAGMLRHAYLEFISMGKISDYDIGRCNRCSDRRVNAR